MKNRFIVGVNGMTEEEEKAFISYIRDKRMGWWHWVSNFWLLVDPSEQIEVVDIRDVLIRVAPGKRNLVLQVEIEDESTWAGLGPTGEKNDMFNWIRKTWSQD